MSTSDRWRKPSPPGVVPRWEWRTFGDFAGADQTLAALRVPDPAESDETYVLSMYGDASVKIRDSLLDIKVLQRLNGSGLQLWVPTTKVAFPVDDVAVSTALEALGVPPTTSGPSGYSYQEFLAEVIEPCADLRVVEVHKSRHRSVLDDCMVEYTEVTAGGKSIKTVAVESPDPELVCRTIGKLGLEGRRNTCVATGLRSLLGWEPSRFAVLDVGTNSVKFIIGERRDGSEPHIAADTAIVTRLGQGLTETGDLTAAAMERTVDAIAHLVEDARRDGPIDIVAVGTAGLRQARNRDTFLQ
jgi:exopolyphosphatase / guanosine-5'-triphosphate,3'-diphosphate pyrophosphatase